MPDLGSPSVRTVLAPLISMTVFQVMVTMAILTLPVFAVRLGADLGVPASWVGIYMSVVFSAAMIGAILGGPAVKRFGAIRLAQICLVLAGVGLLGLTVGTLVAVVFSALILGAAYGPPTPVSSHILARTTPPHLIPIVFSLKQTGVPAGGALAGVVVPLLVLLWGWQGAASAVAVACFCVALGLQPLRRHLDGDRDPHAQIGRDPFAPLRLVMGDAGLRRMSLLSFTYSSVQMSLIAYLVTFMVTEVHYSLIAAGAILAVAQIAGVIGRVAWGAVSGTLVSPRILLALLGFLMSAAAAATAHFDPTWDPWIIYGIAAVFGATAIGWNGVFLAELALVAPKGQAGVATGGSVFVTFAGVVISPALFAGLVALGFGYKGGFLLLSAMGLTGALLVLFDSRQR